MCDQLVPETFINAHIDSSCRSFLSNSATSASASTAPTPVNSTLPGTKGREEENPSTEGKEFPTKKRKLGSQTQHTSSPSLVRQPPLASTSATSSSSKHPRPPTLQNKSKPNTTTSNLNSARPLPDLVRPQTLDDLIGQEHLLSAGTLLRGLIERDRIGSCLFWGPPVGSFDAMQKPALACSKLIDVSLTGDR